jgi:hypothetical protein
MESENKVLATSTEAPFKIRVGSWNIHSWASSNRFPNAKEIKIKLNSLGADIVG